MTPIEDKLRAAIRARAEEIEPYPPPLRLPTRRRRSLFPAHGGDEKNGTPAQRAWPGWGAPAASAVMVGVVIVASAVIFGGRFASPSPVRSPVGRTTYEPTRTLIAPEFLGVYPAGRGYGPVASFAKAAGQRPNIVEYISHWNEPFPASYAQTLRRHGAFMMVQIAPTYTSVKKIAAGDYDSYLRSYADSVRIFGHGIIIGFGHEMNAPWYSWGYGHTPPATFVAAWRHIVTVFRTEGAYNVTWLWTINADQAGTGPVASWWPGANFVTWVGIDGYYSLPPAGNLRPHLRPHHRSGQGVHQQAGPAIRDRRRAWSRPEGRDPQPVRGHAQLPNTRTGVVRPGHPGHPGHRDRS